MDIEETYNEFEDLAFGYADGEDESDFEEFDEDDSYEEDFDNFLTDIDFSEVRGKDFRKTLSSVNKKLRTKVIAPNSNVIVEGKGSRLNSQLPRSGQRVIAPNNDVIIEGRQKPKRPAPIARQDVPKQRQGQVGKIARDTRLPSGERIKIKGKTQKINKVIVPDDQKVIIQGVSNFILSHTRENESIKNIGYYKGKKLQELVFTFNNNTALPFNLELFNPSMPLDYLYSTSLNLNDKIEVAGGQVSYTDVLFNVLANSTMIANSKFVFSGALVNQQRSIPIIVKNKSINGEQKIYPFNLELKVDNMQVASDIVYFDFFTSINRPFIPDGMDVIQYTILPQMTVTMAFFYDQINLKKVFRKEARYDKGLL
jgi:hypothetical protein